MVAIGRNVPLEPHKRPFVLIRRVGSIGDDIPSKRICFLWGVIGCMALKTLRCCGGASSPEQGSVLRAIYPINSHKKHTRLLGGLSLINTIVGAQDCASRGSLGDHIWLRRPWSGWLWPRPLLTIAPQGGTPTNWGSTESFF